MKELFAANNTIEARLVYNLLVQAGLQARVDGELLQGGAGELQAFGSVRVLVADEDYAQAREILERWDAGEDFS